MYFRPEDADRRSGVADIVPEAARRDGEVHQRLTRNLASRDDDLNVFIAVFAVNMTDAVRPNHHRHAQQVPTAVSPVVARFGVHDVVRRHGRERMHHPDIVRAGGQHQRVRGFQAVEGGLHFLLRGAQLRGHFGGSRRAPLRDEVMEDGLADALIVWG